MFAILSQPLGIINDVLTDAYPTGEEYNTGRTQNINIQTVVGLALGAAIIIGVIFLFLFYSLKNVGGGKDSFG